MSKDEVMAHLHAHLHFWDLFQLHSCQEGWVHRHTLRPLNMLQGQSIGQSPSPHDYELVSSGKWLIGGSGPLTWRNAALVGIFVCKTRVYGVSALGAQDEIAESSLPSWCLQYCETRRYRRVLQIMGHTSLNHRVKSHLV